MASSYDAIATQPLIIELLLRRNWFKPQQLEEIEGRPSAGRRSGTLAEATLTAGGYIPEQEVTRIYGEDLFLPVISEQRGGRCDRQGSRRPAPRRSSASSGSSVPQRVRDDVLDVPVCLARGDGRG